MRGIYIYIWYQQLWQHLFLVLLPYCICKLNDTFEVLQLTGKKMRLKSETLCLTFRKF